MVDSGELLVILARCRTDLELGVVNDVPLAWERDDTHGHCDHIQVEYGIEGSRSWATSGACGTQREMVEEPAGAIT
jgi:hypothetical protein